MGDGVSVLGKEVDNNRLTTPYSISSANPAQQFYKANWSAVGPTPVKAVMFATDETLMTAGLIKFYVDGVVCPDTNGVGINASGGVFNCDLVGSEFLAICEETCTPNLAITEVVIWQLKAVSIGGNPHTFEGNSVTRGDINKVFEGGTYFENDW